MKLQRFTASDTQRAILKVHKALGPDALIYSTRKIPEGIEILAGIAENVQNSKPKEVQIQNVNFDNAVVDKLNIQLQVMEESIQNLSTHINTLNQVIAENISKNNARKWNFFKNIGRLKRFLIEGRYGRQTAH
ncbi:MAG: hypothetical protein ABI597_01020 [Gammaproteobacteria bacterium]